MAKNNGLTGCGVGDPAHNRRVGIKHWATRARANHLFNIERKVWEASLTPISRNIRTVLELSSGIGVGDPSHKFLQIRKVIGPEVWVVGQFEYIASLSGRLASGLK